MKKFVGFLCLLLCLCSLCACSGKGELGLYILAADQVGDGLSAGELGKLALQSGRLALSGSDFTGVDWERQYFAVRPEAVQSVSTVTAESGGSSLLKTTDKEIFVWVLDGKALYVGGFIMGTSNPAEPKDPYLKDKERYCFAIETNGSGEDQRFNKSLYQWFYRQGLIKSELS